MSINDYRLYRNIHGARVSKPDAVSEEVADEVEAEAEEETAEEAAPTSAWLKQDIYNYLLERGDDPEVLDGLTKAELLELV